VQIPFFYINDHDSSATAVTLDEDTSRHIVQVLRMKKGEAVHLTDGKGNLLITTITEDHKKHCSVKVADSRFTPPSSRKISIGISLIKNAGRFEWFLEKATEIGVNEIIPLICQRTEKQKFRSDRMNNILVSAMLQSQQVWLPVLHEPIAFELLFRQEEVAGMSQKFIAHCIEESKKNLSEYTRDQKPSQIILIGPEGDFTPAEVELALQHHFIPVSLGSSRLRTETAGVVAATLLRVGA
jgi:16S rRNA (uracil1498-N3)-methyltransferase